MKLKTITCSGPNETTRIDSLISLFLRYPKAEIGVQVSGKKASFGTARYWWLKTLHLYQTKIGYNVPIALHINSDWVESLGQGEVPQEIDEFLRYHWVKGRPFISRVQLNFRIGRDKTPDKDALLTVMETFKYQRFILSFNKDNADLITELYKKNPSFDCLFDDSHGEGLLPENHSKPVFGEQTLQGYAGGLGPENVLTELNKISEIVSDTQGIYIDAEGKLKGEQGFFSLKKAEDFLEKASNWHQS